jgi:hypothetical protein
MVGTGTRGAGLMLVGAALLLLSLVVFGYSRFVEWQHALELQTVAPPRERLLDSFPVPTPRGPRPAPTAGTGSP